MYKNIGSYYIYDGEIKTSDSYKPLQADDIVYEVLRVLDGHILFLDDHMKRLSYSLEKVGMVADISMIKRDIKRLVEKNNIDNKNIKIDIISQHYRLYFMESYYPDERLYKTGVKTTIIDHERDNPTVKKLNMDYKKYIEKVKGQEFFEVLLMNGDGNIIEGSRSNLVYIIDNVLYSAPLNEILSGITFSNVIKMSKKNNFDLKYDYINKSMLDKVDACFLTGTSLGVLPIKSIDGYNFDSSHHPIVLKLIEEYNSNAN